MDRGRRSRRRLRRAPAAHHRQDPPRHPRRPLRSKRRMTAENCRAALEREASRDRSGYPARRQCGGYLGEMGIGNTASAALLMHGLTGRCRSRIASAAAPVADDAGLKRKREGADWAAVRAAAGAARRRGALLAEVRRIRDRPCWSARSSAPLRTAASPSSLDGFHRDGRRRARRAHRTLGVLDYCVFGHCSTRSMPHRALLAHLRAEQRCSISACCLGEGSGAALGSSSVVRAAVEAVHEDGVTFEGAGVSERNRREPSSSPCFFAAAQFLTRLPTPAVRDFDPARRCPSRCAIFRWSAS